MRRPLLLLAVAALAAAQFGGSGHRRRMTRGERQQRAQQCRRARQSNQWPLPDFCRKTRVTSSRCNYPTLWLIPGAADVSCTKDIERAKEIFEIDESTVKITPDVIELPGCFEIEMEASLKEGVAAIPAGFFSKVEYQWWNFPEFSKLNCSGAEANGCGGFGNNCYYCDICNSLGRVEEAERSASQSERNFLNQLHGLECPTKIGRYRYRREFCMNDWAAFDEDGDCEFDFVKKHGLGDYKQAWETLRQIGFGSMIAKFYLAHNATDSQFSQKRAKEAEIAAMVRQKFVDGGGSASPHFEANVAYRTQFRQDDWHRKFLLPWLLSVNQVSCLKVTFDVCDKKPIRSPFDTFRRGGSQTQYDCPR